MMSWLDSLLFWRKPAAKPILPIIPQVAALPQPNVEIFATPGHGRTSYLWSLLYMLRQMSQVWPEVLCWPQDEATGEALKAIHENLRLGRLPARGIGDEVRYSLVLRNFRPWGQQRLLVFDRPDPVFGQRDAEQQSLAKVNWKAQALWLLSLSDLDEVHGRYLDIALEDLLRARGKAGASVQTWPFRVVVVLTKTDAVPDLPPELRCFLKEDPIAKNVTFDDTDIFRADSKAEVDLGEAFRQGTSIQRTDLLQFYLDSMKEIDHITRSWLEDTQGGQTLVRRAKDYGVNLRFCVVSATGSGVVSGEGLGTAWSPRRVLDPYFWALELERELS